MERKEGLSSMSHPWQVSYCYMRVLKKVSLKVKTNKKENSSEYYAQEDYITVF